MFSGDTIICFYIEEFSYSNLANHITTDLTTRNMEFYYKNNHLTEKRHDEEGGRQ